ncbi:NADH-quinone oxidoreductase subunit A [Rhabdothermincola sp.]|uniref:NADH-quinone oxidoreductase subunit A n=1 Tax=Rhabdothermincola sp. TaxID=2820405 RepID=UPI002FDF1A60
MAQYLPIFALLVLAVLFGAVSRVAQRLLVPPKPTPPKVAPYECGIIPTREPPERFPVKFFLVAMIFIVFDIEIIFFFPFALAFRDLGGFGIAAVAIFALAVFESFVYLIAKGALEWGPVRRERPSELVSPTRTAATTVRRVGTEGRQPAVVGEAA